MDIKLVTLSTSRLFLDHLTLDDTQAIFNLRSNPIVLKFLGRPPMQSLQEAEDWIANGNKSLENNEGINWAIRLKDTNEFVGTIGFWKIIPERWRAEIGYSLMPHYHRQGLMHEAASAVISFGFTKMKLHSIQAEIDPFNLGSEKLLEKLGFKKEAHFTENYYWQGNFSDSAVYSILEKWKKF